MAFLLMTLCVIYFARESHGHGYMKDPPSRSSMWRDNSKYPDSPPNYDDNQLFCGGRQMIQRLGGLCGPCGDPYEGKRENEAGGKYARGIITRKLPHGAKMLQVEVMVTAYHKGYYEFRICPHNDPTKPVSQECLNDHLMTVKDGSKKFPTRYYPKGAGSEKIQVYLPRGIKCSQCVVQWRYRAGNSWGTDPDGTQCVGCGVQEEFRNCADISIGGDGVDASSIFPANDVQVKRKNQAKKSDNMGKVDIPLPPVVIDGTELFPSIDMEQNIQTWNPATMDQNDGTTGIDTPVNSEIYPDPTPITQTIDGTQNTGIPIEMLPDPFNTNPRQPERNIPQKRTDPDFQQKRVNFPLREDPRNGDVRNTNIDFSSRQNPRQRNFKGTVDTRQRNRNMPPEVDTRISGVRGRSMNMPADVGTDMSGVRRRMNTNLPPRFDTGMSGVRGRMGNLPSQVGTGMTVVRGRNRNMPARGGSGQSDRQRNGNSPLRGSLSDIRTSDRNSQFSPNSQRKNTRLSFDSSNTRSRLRNSNTFQQNSVRRQNSFFDPFARWRNTENIWTRRRIQNAMFPWMTGTSQRRDRGSLHSRQPSSQPALQSSNFNPSGKSVNDVFGQLSNTLRGRSRSIFFYPDKAPDSQFRKHVSRVAARKQVNKVAIHNGNGLNDASITHPGLADSNSLNLEPVILVENNGSSMFSVDSNTAEGNGTNDNINATADTMQTTDNVTIYRNEFNYINPNSLEGNMQINNMFTKLTKLVQNNVLSLEDLERSRQRHAAIRRAQEKKKRQNFQTFLRNNYPHLVK